MKSLNTLLLGAGILLVLCIESAHAQTGPGYAISLNGSGQYLTVPTAAASALTGPFTIEAWVYVRAYADWSRLSDFATATGNNEIVCMLSVGMSGRPDLQCFNSAGAETGSISVPSALPLNMWTHLAFTCDGATGRIFTNGILAVSGPMTTPSGPARTSNFIGRSNWPGDADANATIDEVRIWNVARTQAEIQANMLNAALPGSTPGLVAYWHFDAGTGTSATDATGHGNTGTLVNGPLWKQFPGLNNPFVYNITATNAMVAEDVATFGQITAAWFQWGANATYGNTTTSNVFISDTTVTKPLTNLTAGTAYHWRSVAFNSVGTSYGTDQTFTTVSTNANLSALTFSAGTFTPAFSSAITAYSASLPNSVATTTVTPTAAGGLNATIQVRVNGGAFAPVTSGTASSPLSLVIGTNTIVVKVTAQDSATVKTYSITATRAAIPPSVTSLAASSISQTAATLNGTVNPNGSSSYGWFQWGLNTNYGYSTPSVSVGSGSAPVARSAALNGLTQGVLYQFRAVGSNVAGLFYGVDQSFQFNPMPPVVTGLMDFQNAGLWRKEVRKQEIARCYRQTEWTTTNTIWFERGAESLWITRPAVESFLYRSHCIYRFPNGRIWTILRTFARTDLRRFSTHYRFWWAGRANPLLSLTDTNANRTMMSMDEVQIVLPMTPADPNPGTPGNEAVMITDENGVEHLQGEPGFELPPDIAGNPNGYQLLTTALSTDQLPPAADRIQDVPMPLMPGMANLQPGVVIQWLVDRNGNVMVDHDMNGYPDSLTSSNVLGGQKHQGLITPAIGTAGTELSVDQGNTQLQLFCWELDSTGEVRGASPGQVVIGPPVDLNGDGVADGPIGSPVPSDPTVRQLVVNPSSIQEQQDPSGKPVDLAVVESASPTDAELAAMNANLAAQIPGFVPLQRPFILCMSKIHMRRIWSVDHRSVFDTSLHHLTWQHRNGLVLTDRALRVWLTKVSLAQFSYSRRRLRVGQPPDQVFDLLHLRFLRVGFRVIVVSPNQIALKIDQMHVVVPDDPNNPNSQLMLLSTQGDENRLFREVPPPVLAGLQPDPLPVGPDGVGVEPIDPVSGTLDFGLGGTGVFDNHPLEARGVLPVILGGNEDAATAPENNQLQLYCWVLNPNGTIAGEPIESSPGLQVPLAMTPTPALPLFEDENGNPLENPTMFITTLTSADNKVYIQRLGNGNVQLSWDGPGQLQAAGAATGYYQDMPGATLSPVVVTPGQLAQFYRVRR